MKSILYLGIFLIHGLAFAQDVEERNELAIENSNNINFLNIKSPIYQLSVKGCDQLEPAVFEGGMNEFKIQLKNYMYDFLNSDLYKLNGDFTFIITIDENGSMTDIVGSPQVPNSKYFFDDMKYIIRRMKVKWQPAHCEGKPVMSNIKVNIAFSSLAIEV